MNPTHPQFITGSQGKLFTLLDTASRTTSPKLTSTAVLFIPPFAEEMNKCRRMFSLQARHLAANGIVSFRFDLFGTGDSEGDFGQANWAMWLDDIEFCSQLLVEQGFERVLVVSLRFGSLLACDAIQKSKLSIDRHIMWQPVLNGSDYLTQFLRLKLVSSMLDSDSEAKTTSSLKQQLRNGDAMEVAGYLLSPDLALAIEYLSLNNMDMTDFPDTDWVEVIQNEKSDELPTGRRCTADACKKNGLNISVHTVKDVPFWSTIDTTEALSLVEKTTSLILNHA